MSERLNGGDTLGVLEGARAIGEYLGSPGTPVNPRRVLWLAQQGRIRTFHNGRTLCATQRSLREDIAAMQNGATGS
jgi:hypothetical protein